MFFDLLQPSLARVLKCSLSAQLGAGFLVGYVAGDFFFANTGWGHIFGVRLPLLITYALLALPAIFFSLFTKALVVRFTILPRIGRRIGPWASVVGGGVVVAVLSWALVYLWTDTASVLLRPVFTWQGEKIPPRAHPGIAE